MCKLSKRSLSESITFEANTRKKFDEVMRKKLKSQIFIFFITLSISVLNTFQLHFFTSQRGFLQNKQMNRKHNMALKTDMFL